MRIILLIPFILVACIFESDDNVEPWNAEKVCPAEGTNSYGMPNRGTFVDERDGEVYRYTTIGDQVWMAENLRYDAPYSTCSNDTSFIRQYCELIEHNCENIQCCKESLCHNFGRYYSIIQNDNRFGLIDKALADTICPSGWHIPTMEEWESLNFIMRVQGESVRDAATRMKSGDSIYFSISKLHLNENDRTYAGTNNCALSVLPSGYMYEDGETLKNRASLWTSTQKNTEFVYTFRVANDIEFVSHYFGNTIRCIKDSINPES